MASYYVAFFPDLSSHRWISEFRNANDPKAELVQAHITLVNPISDFPLEKLKNEVAATVKKIRKFKAVFRSSLIMPEVDKSRSHLASIFLVPDEGFSSIIRLRYQLYEGDLNPFLRLDISFVPHITIGLSTDLQKAKKLVDAINSKPFEVVAEVDQISIVEIESANVDRSIVCQFSLS